MSRGRVRAVSPSSCSLVVGPGLSARAFGLNHHLRASTKSTLKTPTGFVGENTQRQDRSTESGDSTMARKVEARIGQWPVKRLLFWWTKSFSLESLLRFKIPSVRVDPKSTFQPENDLDASQPPRFPRP
ncbi:hypothetical protein B0H11DRAFT_1911243 [Mycena galericulata]|nr:hypothetical protein B0H11DRAFT_1911243 [Mycena galericulata]